MDQKINTKYNDLSPISRKIYNSLLTIGKEYKKEYFRRRDIQNIVLRYRIKNDINGKQIDEIRKLLFEIGLTERRVNQIMSQISYKFKLGLDDAYEIEKELFEHNLIYYNGNHKIYLTDDSLVL